MRFETIQPLADSARKLWWESTNRHLRRDDAGTHPVYQVDKGLSIISGEMFNRLYLIIVREDGRYQGDALVRGKGNG
jgi:hypothetical protein